MRRSVFGVIIAIVVFSGVIKSDDSLPENLDIIGIEGTEEQSWLAIRLEIPADTAIAGLQWYNNDGQVTFPGLLIGTGHQDGPGQVSDMVTLTETFSGENDGWSDIVFDQPVAAAQNALYVVFVFPAGVPYNGRGIGGGPAIGYLADDSGTTGWISGDGESWLQISNQFSFAVLPVFVPFEDGMLVKNLDGDHERLDSPVLASYLRPAPNPFNPQTELQFGLLTSGQTIIEVFDVRGRLITRLLDEFRLAGRHAVTWTGLDDSGRPVASGVYLVRMRHGSEEMRQRLLLVR